MALVAREPLIVEKRARKRRRGQDFRPGQQEAAPQTPQGAPSSPQAPPTERPAVAAAAEPVKVSRKAPAGSKDEGERMLAEMAQHVDTIFPLRARAELLKELALVPEGVPADQISARLAAVRYANHLSGIVTVAESKAAEAGSILPVIRAAGSPDGTQDAEWKPPANSTPQEAAKALVAEARPMDGWKPPEKPVTPLKGAFHVVPQKESTG